MSVDSFEACQLKSEKRWHDIDIKLQKIADDQSVMEARLNKQSKLLEDIQELSRSVALLASNMEGMLKEQKSQNERLHVLEDKPRKRVDGLIDTILKVVITAAVGALLVKIGLSA